MTKKQLTKLLIKLHRKYSGRRTSNEESQMCEFWSVTYPPDELEDTEPLLEIEKALGVSFTEDQAIEFYGMIIEEAVDYMLKLEHRQKD